MKTFKPMLRLLAMVFAATLIFSGCAKDYDDQLRTLEQRVNALQATIEQELAAEMTLINNQITALESEMATHSSNLETLSAADAERAQTYAGICTDLATLKEDLDSRIKEMCATMDENSEDCALKIKQLKSWVTIKLILIGSRIDDVNEDLNELTCRVDEMDSTTQDLLDYDMYLDSLCAAHEETLCRLEKELERADKKMKEDIEKNKKEIHKNMEEIKDLQRDLRKTTEKLERKICEALEEAKCYTDEQIEILQGCVEDNREDIEELCGKYRHLNREVYLNTKSIKEIKWELKDIKKCIKTLEVKVCNLEREVCKLLERPQSIIFISDYSDNCVKLCPSINIVNCVVLPDTMTWTTEFNFIVTPASAACEIEAEDLQFLVNKTWNTRALTDEVCVEITSISHTEEGMVTVCAEVHADVECLINQEHTYFAALKLCNEYDGADIVTDFIKLCPEVKEYDDLCYEYKVECGHEHHGYYENKSIHTVKEVNATESSSANDRYNRKPGNEITINLGTSRQYHNNFHDMDYSNMEVLSGMHNITNKFDEEFTYTREVLYTVAHSVSASNITAGVTFSFDEDGTLIASPNPVTLPNLYAWYIVVEQKLWYSGELIDTVYYTLRLYI